MTHRDGWLNLRLAGILPFISLFLSVPSTIVSRRKQWGRVRLGHAAGLLLPLLLLLVNEACFAQSTNSGDIRGSATDKSGALIPDVTVTVLNVDTGVSKDYSTNQDGLYDTSSIVAGSYTVTFTKTGFEQLVRGPITLQVGMTTVNAQLEVGSTKEQITVTTDVPLLQTESGEQTVTWDAQTMDAMPEVSGIQGEDWGNQVVFLPGMSGTPTGSYGVTMMQQWGSANGSLPYNNILEDGASNSLGGSMIASDATLDTVAELQVSLSNFSAQYGSGGVVINQITKGGTNQFHGAGYDFLQNNKLNAAEYGFGNRVPIPYIRFNNFGGDVSGPILKKKMFFFFNYDQVVDHGSASNTTLTIPTSDVMSGNFAAAGIVPTIYDPTSQTIATDSAGNLYPVRKSFQQEYGTNAIPSNLIDSVANAVQQYFPTPSNHIPGSKFVTPITNSLGVQTQNFFSSLPQSTPYRKFFGRLDYDITSKNRLSMSDTQNDTPVEYPSSFTACPLGCEGGDVDNNNAQITDVWNISPRVINEARMGFTFQGNWFDDNALDHGYASKVGWQFAKVDDFPTVYLTNYQSMGPASNATGFENVWEPSDVVTMIRGKHILHFGGELLAYRMNYTAWGDENAGTMNFSGQYTQNWSLNSQGVASPDPTTGLDYADFLLGLAQSWNAGVIPEYGARLKIPQMFFQDDYKIRPNLTVNLGLRYQITHGMSEVHGNLDSFDPTVMNPATNTLGAIWYGSTHANGRTALEANTFNSVLPRVGFSWSVKPDTTFRGGFGVYTYNFTLDMYAVLSPMGMGGPFSTSGNISDSTSGVTPVVKLDGNGTMIATPVKGQSGLVSTTTPLPYTAAITTPDAYNGQNVGYYTYHTPVPKIYQWNLTAQHMLGQHTMASLAYVGSHGFDLSYLTDLDQVPESELSPNDTQYRPYPNYTSISGSTNNGRSNYNSLQAIITRRMSNGLSLSANYVWSHFLDSQDSGGTGRAGGERPFQIAQDPSADYSNSNFDTRNAFKAYAVYELPFGKGRKFLSSSPGLEPLVGGWQISTTDVQLSGNPFTVFSTQNTYAQVGSAFPNWSGVNPTPANRSVSEWYNPAAFLQPANGTFGNVRRNSLYGPGNNEVNLSAAKTIKLPWEGIELKAHVDAVNAFNHPSFGVPNQYLSGSSGPGTPYTSPANISWVQVGGRNVQIGMRVSF
ncbi:MAG: TonB-dependent receptor [Terracidiphilus sp.]|jgi:hypothetical protein